MPRTLLSSSFFVNLKIRASRFGSLNFIRILKNPPLWEGFIYGGAELAIHELVLVIPHINLLQFHYIYFQAKFRKISIYLKSRIQVSKISLR